MRDERYLEAMDTETAVAYVKAGNADAAKPEVARWLGANGTEQSHGETIMAWGKDVRGYLVAVRTVSGAIYEVDNLPARIAAR